MDLDLDSRKTVDLDLDSRCPDSHITGSHNTVLSQVFDVQLWAENLKGGVR